MEFESHDSLLVVHDEWDAGDLACGPMLLTLKGRLARLAPGQTIRVMSRDEGAPFDVPAWCRLTGHKLLRSAHPEYLIQKNQE